MSNIFCVWSVGQTSRVGALGSPLWIIQYWPLSEILIRMEQSHICGSGMTVTDGAVQGVFFHSSAPSSHSSAQQPSAAEWLNSRAELPFRTTNWLQIKQKKYLLILWCVWWWVFQILWLSFMLPQLERKGKIASAMKVHLSVCTFRAQSKSNQPSLWICTVLDKWNGISALVCAQTLGWHLPLWVWRIWNRCPFLIYAQHQDRCGTRAVQHQRDVTHWVPCLGPEEELIRKLREILLVPLQLQLLDDELLLFQMECDSLSFAKRGILSFCI